MPCLGHPNKEIAILCFLTGFLGVVAYQSVLNTLYTFRAVTRVNTEQKQPGMIGQHTEDAISVDTLGELYNSPNWDIKQAALKILIERSVRSPNLELLLRNAASKDLQVREDAFSSLAFLASVETSRMSLRVPQIYRIVVDALVSYLPESSNRPHEPHTDWKLRTKTEQCAITVLKNVLMMPTNGGMALWLEAGLVTRWLGQFPYGGEKAKQLKGEALSRARKKILDTINSRQTEDGDLEFIFQELSRDSNAWAQLRKFDLVDAYQGSDDPWKTPQASNNVVVVRRGLPSSDNEVEAMAARRRRRREAVVIGDADQPLSQDNIFNVDDTQTEYEGFSRVL